MFFDLSFGVFAVANDDHNVVDFDESGCCTVDADFSRATDAWDHVGSNSTAVGNIQDVNLFEGDHFSGLQQIQVDGDAAFVVQIRLSDSCAVDF